MILSFKLRTYDECIASNLFFDSESQITRLDSKGLKSVIALMYSLHWYLCDLMSSISFFFLQSLSFRFYMSKWFVIGNISTLLYIAMGWGRPKCITMTLRLVQNQKLLFPLSIIGSLLIMFVGKDKRVKEDILKCWYHR